MKTSIFITIVVASIISCLANIINIIRQEDYLKKQNHKIELMQKALEMSDNILDSHNIWDTDGSDYMSDYLMIRQEIDSTFLSGFNKY